MDVEGSGIRVRLPRGWEGALRTAPAVPAAAGRAGTGVHAGPAATDAAPADLDRRPAPPVLHLGTFPLPADRGDFGSGAVELMREDDTFVALLEYDREEAGTPLFAAHGLPRRLDPRRFSNRSLQRQLPGQAGWQHFFTDGARPFCLYVVLGDRHDANVQVRRVEQVLAGLQITPARGGEAPR